MECTESKDNNSKFHYDNQYTITFDKLVNEKESYKHNHTNMQ